uniref:Genome polyprotein n=1 Tax=Soybean thrips iflavirus 8 TaxID=2802958 RepID=A0A7T8FZQ4_9VIRU|nr:polyprotein [Soybean thrips iflavirus 8]
MGYVASSDSRGARGGELNASYHRGNLKEGVYNYANKSECYMGIRKKLDLYVTTWNKDYNSSVCFTSVLNSWIMSTGYHSISTRIKNYARSGMRDAYFECRYKFVWRTCQGFVEIEDVDYAPIRREAINRASWSIMRKIGRIPQVQIDIPHTTESNQDMEDQLIDSLRWVIWCKRNNVLQYPRVQIETPEKTTEQGDVTQESDKQRNTIITRDQQETKSVHTCALDTVSKIASSEPPHNFGSITERWMPLGPLKFSINSKLGDTYTYYLPESLYLDNCAPSLIPFETFIYGRMDLEFRLVVNANKFSCGKIIMSSKYDSYQADNSCIGIQSALARNHVIVDLGGNNEGVLSVPFRYHRPYIRLMKNDNTSLGVRPSKYASLYIQVLSPLQTGKDGPSEIYGRLFFRFVSSEFTGMSYRVPITQMFGVEKVLTKPTTSALKELLVGAEKAFDQLGKSNNQDKPSVLSSTSITPRPRYGFPGGKGLMDVVPLRVNPHTLTNYKDVVIPRDEPRNFYDLARIWGVVKEFEWSSGTASGDSLLNMRIDPTLRYYDTDYIGEPTPLEYAMNNYAFWAGDIELRLDFVSNAYHTGTVQLSAEFGRVTQAKNMCESSATYVKTFHLGDQKSVSFKVPYIYDTVMRRTTGVIYNPYHDLATSDDIKKRSMSIAPESRTYFKVRVVNELRPIASAPQTIKVLVFMRAGKNFTLHGLKSNTARIVGAAEVKTMDNFPQDGYDHIKPEGYKVAPTDVKNRSKRETNPKLLPIEVRNYYNEVKPERIPYVQMDNGEKEDQDKTDTFNTAKNALITLTLDRQVDFKDLLRRPTLIVSQQKIPQAKAGNAWFLPIMPPSRMMCSTTWADSDFWSQALSQTSAVSIMDMFRVWRGSMRYTIVVRTKDAEPFYVSFIPHSGTRILGTHEFQAPEGKQVLYGANFTTELVVPSINPTVTIEAPYETENTWTLTWEDDALLNYSWRDKGDTNAGHIAITNTSEKDMVVDIWWSAGDDFAIANYYGIPRVKINAWAYRWNDSAARVQMDFQNEEPNTTVAGFLRRNIKSIGKTTMRAAVATIPVIGTPLVVADVVNTVENTVESLSDSAKVTLHKVNTLSDTVGVSVEQLTELLNKTIESIGSTIGGLISGTAMIYDVLLDLLIAWIEKSWYAIGVGIIRFISKLLCKTTDIIPYLMDQGKKISEYIRDIMTAETPNVQIDVNDSNNVSTYVGLLAGVIGTILGVHISPTKSTYDTFLLLLGHRLTSTQGVAYLLTVIRFFQATFTTIQNLIMRALGYVSPEAEALKQLSNQNEIINQFVREAQIMTSEANANLVSNPAYRKRFWINLLQAHKIQRLLTQVPNNCASYQLTKLCADVIKMGNDKFMDLSASPVRFVPMMVCLEGAPGIGKSFMTERFADALLAAVGITNCATEKTYYRTSGEKFWSGYRNQPIVVYDEMFNTRDAERNMATVVELMKLKSTSIFVPEMAHLEEKKIRGNPYIIIICCNEAFPNNLGDYATEPEAVLRRRDIVLHAARTEEYQGRDPMMEPQLNAAFDQMLHLKFKVYKDSRDKTSLTSTWKNYTDMEKWTLNFWDKYYKQELLNVRKRMERIPGYIEQIDNLGRIDDPFSLFYQLNTVLTNDETQSNAWTPYEQLEMAVSMVSDAIQARVDDEAQPDMELDPLPDWDTPVTESVFTDIGIGMLATGFGLRTVVKFTKSQLIKLESYLNPLTPVINFCNVCHDEEAPCAYVCKSSRDLEAKHYVCIHCYPRLMNIGNGTCPLCRCEEMCPIMNDFTSLSLWIQIAIKCGRGLRYVCDKLLQYWNFRINAFITGGLIDYLIQVAIQIRTGSGAVSLPFQGDMYMRAGYWIYENTDYFMSNLRQGIFGTEQGDDWDDAGPSTEPTPATVHRDLFSISLNSHYVEHLPRIKQPFCLHNKVMMHVRCATLVGDKWRVPDEVTKKIVEIPLNLCEDSCHLDEVTLENILEQYMIMHKQALRLQYIDYYNRPSKETLYKIPEVYRAEWMLCEEIQMNKSWWEYLSEQWEQYKTTIAYITAVIGVLGGLYKAYEFATRLVSTTQVSATAGSAERQARNPNRYERSRLTRSQRYTFQSDVNMSDPFVVALGAIHNNTFKIIVEVGNGKEVIMYGTGLFNSYLLIPKHYSQQLKVYIRKNFKIFGHPFSKPQLKQCLVLTDKSFVESQETDLAYLLLPPKMPLFRDIRKFLATEEDIMKNDIPSTGILFGNPKCGGDFMREIEIDLYGIRDSQIIMDQNDDTFEVNNVLVYNYSKPGACGSLVLREKHQRPILGMHFAGMGDGVLQDGFAILLTREALQDLYRINTVPVQFDDQPFDSIEHAKFVFEDDVHLNYLGSVPKEKVPHTPTKSKLRPSAIHNYPSLVTDMEPAILDKNDRRYVHQETPLSAGIRKHGKITEDFEQERIDKVGEQFWDLWLSAMKPSMMRPLVLTDEEAILGKDIEHYTAMDLKTSAGYPFTINKQKTSKYDWVTVERNEAQQIVKIIALDPELDLVLEDKRQLRRQGIVPITIFTDTLKDEKRPREKARKLGGTRVFCSSPMDYVIECRKYFLHFVAAFMKNRAKLMHAVGINPTSDEWTGLVNELLRKNSKFGTIDYSNFGPGYNAGVAKKAYELIIRWTMEHVTTSEGYQLNERELWCIVYECLQSVHICNNTVYQQGAGSPSGAFFTTIINTMVNILYILLAWDILISDKIEDQTLSGVEFKKNVSLFCYGDDGIFSVTSKYEDLFNMQTLIKLFQNYNIVATSSDKTAEIQKFENISEATFLKRGFKKHPTRKGKWLAPLKWESVLSCTQWIWASPNLKEATHINANAALMEAYGHGKDKFEFFKKEVNQALRKAKIQAVTGTWEEFDALFFDKGFEFNMDVFLLNNLY